MLFSLQDQGCLPGLVIFLDNDNPQVVLTALEVSGGPALKVVTRLFLFPLMEQALNFLAQVPSNRPLMKNEIGLLISIRRIINR